MAECKSLKAIKEVLSLAQTVWGTSYVMDASGAIYPLSGNGPNFDSLYEVFEILSRNHIGEKHARRIREWLSKNN